MSALAHLGAVPAGEGRWRVRVPEALHGAYGGAFGGLLGALTVGAARQVATGRQPFALDCYFLRGLRGDDAELTTDVVRSGRSLSVVSVSITEDGSLATRATVLLAELSALDDWSVPDAGEPPAGLGGGKPWGHPPDRRVGIVDTLAPRAARLPDGRLATTIRVPWPESAAEASAEMACMAADLATGPPVASALEGGWRPHPNPDLSLRFLPRGFADDEITGVGRLEGVVAGVAMMSLAVWAGGQRIATGAATALVAPARPGGGSR